MKLDGEQTADCVESRECWLRTFQCVEGNYKAGGGLRLVAPPSLWMQGCCGDRWLGAGSLQIAWWWVLPSPSRLGSGGQRALQGEAGGDRERRRAPAVLALPGCDGQRGCGSPRRDVVAGCRHYSG